MIRHSSSLKPGLATILILGILVLTFNVYTQKCSAQSTQNINLTNTWKADDGI
jgi:hypothetical protein